VIGQHQDARVSKASTRALYRELAQIGAAACFGWSDMAGPLTSSAAMELQRRGRRIAGELLRRQEHGTAVQPTETR
jgi:hypothetical protein